MMASGPQRVRLSVVVPLGPGETEAAGLLAQLRALPPGCEVVLVHAGAVAGDWPPGLRHVASPPGRARQMNQGASQAAGAWLWFLHADTRLTPGALPALLGFVARDAAALGWFSLAFRPDGPALTRLNARGANLRSRWLGLPFGDQGLVLPAASFAALGGYDEAAAQGEDHLLVWAAHAARLPVRPVGAAVVTSARKYARRGWLRTTGAHWGATAAQAYAGWRNLRHIRRVRRAV